MISTQGQKQRHAPRYQHLCYRNNKGCSKKPLFSKPLHGITPIYELTAAKGKAVVIMKAKLKATKNCSQE
jgi:hypothetical protein